MRQRVIFLDPHAEPRIKRGECPACGMPKSEWKRRKDWMCCSTKCTDYFTKHQRVMWEALRDQVFARDGHKCRMCGNKPTRTERAWQDDEEVQKARWGKRFIRMYEGMVEEYRWERYGPEVWHTKRRTILVKAMLIEYDCPTALVCDHIIPIARGGSQTDMSNLQSLCEKCNKIKTRQDAADIAQHKRTVKIVAANRKLFNQDSSESTS